MIFVFCLMVASLGWLQQDVTAQEIINDDDIAELSYLDTTIDPCDDFYSFACGNFKNIHPRPETSEIIDHFTLLQNDLIKIGNDILSAPKSDQDPTALRKAKAAYSACMAPHPYHHGLPPPELTTINEYGGMPLINSTLDPHFSWPEIGDMVGRYGVPLLFNYGVLQFARNETYIGIANDPLQNPLMLLPAQSNYEHVLEKSFKEHATKKATSPREITDFDVFLRTLSRKLLSIANPGKSDEEMIKDLDDIRNFMIVLYSGGDQEGYKDLSFPSAPSIHQLNVWSLHQFNKEIIDWQLYMSKIFSPAGITINHDTQISLATTPRVIYGVLNLVRKTDPKIVKNFALLRVFLFQAPDSDSVTQQAFEDYYRARNSPLFPRPEYCSRKILDVVATAGLDYAAAYAYQLFHFNINKIPKVRELSSKIQDTFSAIISQLDWMDALSQEAALLKIKNILTLTAFPDFAQNSPNLDAFYENLQICEWDNYGNSRNIRAFRQAYLFSQVALSSTRNFWGKSAFDVNAYYNRPNNKIVVPVSILNGVFFNGSNSLVDYSRLGSVLGHEITHGFDVNGKNYDPDGLQRAWWSDATLAAFMDKAQCFIELYDNYRVDEIQKNVSGLQTINENLADFGGARVAYEAFAAMKRNGEIESSKTGKYSLEQLFFIGYATMWCSDESEAYLTQLIGLSTHAPNRFRVQGTLSNMEEFSEAFYCKKGAAMNPENKCKLW